MNIIKFVIQRKTFVSMIFIGFTLLGYISYKNLPVELLPSVELPVMIVQINGIQEFDPAYVEKQAIIPLEGAIGTLEGIESLDSYADYRSGMIFITYKDNTDIKYAYLKLQEKVEAVKSNLADQFIVNVLKVDTEQLSNQFMDLEVRGGGDVDRIRNIVDNYITEDFESVDGIASVEVFGGREKSIEIILHKDKLDAYGLTASRISAIINQNNQQRTFVGQILHNNIKYFVNVTAESSSISDLEDIVVSPNGPIRLKDISDIFFGVKEETTYSRINGKESVTIRLIRDSQVNLIELSHECKDVITRLNDELKHHDVEIVIQNNLADDMETNIDMIMELALVGGILAIIILWIFLRNFRLVITIGLAIPISIFTAFNFFYAYDISINSLTLIGMALAIGMLLDNSIVVLENIYRLAGDGVDRDRSVIQGTTEVWRSIIAATLTTITVFLPFVFSSNYLVSSFGLHIGVSIVSTLLVSLILALFLIPMITHTFLQMKQNFSGTFQKIAKSNRLIQIYLVLLKSSMRFPARTIISAAIVFFASVFIALAISVNTTEEVESDSFNLYVQMPEGSTLEISDEVARKVEERLADLEEAGDLISKVYEDQSTLTVKLKEDFKDISGKDIEEVKEIIQSRVNDIGDAEISFDEPQSSQRFRGGTGANMGNRFQRMLGIGSQTESIVIKGSDYKLMQSTAEDIQYYLENLSSVQSAQVSVSGERPEIHLLFDSHLLSQYNIPLSSIVSELSTFQREFSSNATFKQGTEEYDITITMDAEDDEDKTMDDLRALKIEGSEGNVQDLQELSKIIYASGMSSINRVNQEKQIEINYRFLSEVNNSKPLLDLAEQEVDDLIASLIIPSGIAVEVVDDESEFEEYYFLIAVAVLLIFMILASVFESLITPFVLLFSIPLAAIGSLIALIFTGNSLLNTNTLTGFLILLGVVVNNGIILIDYANILRKRGFSTPRALINAGLARVRPILITAITTIVAMIPLALGDVEYVAAIGAPFAITVIGGLTFSTLFTLIIIPTLYSGLNSALEWIYNLNWKIKATQIAALISLSLLIYFEVDSFIWQLADLFLIILLIPGLTYFILNSLRQAKTELIKPDDPITIEIKNVVKIYDQASRFVREWNKGKKEKARYSEFNIKPSLFDRLLWQIPLIGFVIYFTYFYVESGFWKFVFVHFNFFLLLYFSKTTFNDVFAKFNLNKISLGKYHFNLYKIIYWLFPLFNLVLFQLLWDNLFLVIVIALLWYPALLINSSSHKLFNESFDEENLSGKFRKLRYKYYSFVRVIPVIGKKRIPFKALDRVSIDIKNGMFGLLGPNGAGKTTIMRIICGILQESYGKVRINGLDRSIYREELQGLIGYLPQAFGMYENMTAYDFLNYQAILKNLIDREEREKRIEYVLKSVHMYDRKDEKIGSYSGGMKQRIGIAQILLHLPRILVVDEPTAGLDPRERIRFRNLLVELSRERIVIFSTHIIEDISSSCDRVAVMNEGKVKYLGQPIEMTQIADGKVWHLHVTQKEFPEAQNKLLIVNHMRDGDRIRIRCISNEKPAENAKSVRATLEDAYLCIQKENETNIFNNSQA
ncbi:MAG: efflux RND transporter permease subunit [Melioribacteraceae bacterium]|nr:efflux RND transporter permease subunit [Melioribacteraceae bacterium]MCF8354470.1 efflux RND transporter permease subunit [Melioribacteraceae bacterium]MCF8394080.1 efflux RND transporter permease subunit [Melioribacteraceae bacterium]MCF8419867.1 efflux RND transporter permease subunit [Melioribacteraceae bacterium]